jgi:hypothetical protein
LALGLGLVLAFGAVWLVVPASSVLAVTCSGSSCNNKSPETTGCSAGAVTLRTAYIRYNGAGPNLAKVELRSSPTCKTRWSRVSSLVGPVDITTDIERSDGLPYVYTDWDQHATSAYSPMVYVGTTKTATSCGVIYNDANHYIECTRYA